MNGADCDRFPTQCPECGAPLAGVLIRQELVTADDVVLILGSLVTRRTAARWLREPSSGGRRVPGVRGRITHIRTFVEFFERHKRELDKSSRSREPAEGLALPSSCPTCDTPLDGFVAPLDLLTLADAAQLLGPHVPPVAIATWVRAGMLRGFRVPGCRSVVVRATDLMAHLRSLNRSDPGSAQMGVARSGDQV